MTSSLVHPRSGSLYGKNVPRTINHSIRTTLTAMKAVGKVDHGPRSRLVSVGWVLADPELAHEYRLIWNHPKELVACVGGWGEKEQAQIVAASDMLRQAAHSGQDTITLQHWPRRRIADSRISYQQIVNPTLFLAEPTLGGAVHMGVGSGQHLLAVKVFNDGDLNDTLAQNALEALLAP